MVLAKLMSRMKRPEAPTPYLQDPGIHEALAPPQPPIQPQPRRQAQAPPQYRQARPARSDYLPAYTPPQPKQRGIHSLPTSILHRILLLLLDPKATPDRFAFDHEIERVHRLYHVFQLRGVDKRFFLLCTALLRSHFQPLYTSLLHPTSSTGLYTILEDRERVVLDRFVALRIGQDLRRAESDLTEDTGEERDIFHRLQPAARIEDVLLDLPGTLVRPTCPDMVLLEFPLPHPLLRVKLTPGWAQVYMQKTMVIEVRRGRNVDETVTNIRQGLEYVRGGVIALGSRIA